MLNPTFQDVREVAETIQRRRSLYTQAVLYKDKAFNDHFQSLPQTLQRDFAVLREEYMKIQEENGEKDPELKDLKTYYRKAARRFHPDITNNDGKVAFFREAVEAYQKKDLQTLQILVLQDMVTEIDTLPEEDQQFLLSEYRTMVSVADGIWKKAAETVVAAATLEQMSGNMFRSEAEDACLLWATEITRRGSRTEGQQSSPLLEG